MENGTENRLGASLKWAAKSALVRQPDRQGVYVMECKGFIKIGIAANPRKRLDNAQTGNPFKIRLLTFKLSDDAKDEEGKLHHMLANAGYHVRGEWFKVPDDVLASLLASLRAKSCLPVVSCSDAA